MRHCVEYIEALIAYKRHKTEITLSSCNRITRCILAIQCSKHSHCVHHRLTVYHRIGIGVGHACWQRCEITFSVLYCYCYCFSYSLRLQLQLLLDCYCSYVIGHHVDVLLLAQRRIVAEGPISLQMLLFSIIWRFTFLFLHMSSVRLWLSDYFNHFNSSWHQCVIFDSSSNSLGFDVWKNWLCHQMLIKMFL